MVVRGQKQRQTTGGIMEWRDIPGYKGYRVSSTGLVLGKRGNILTPWVLNVGYKCVSLGRGYKATVHSLVLLAFVGPRPFGLQCCHRNANRLDNNVENLRWDTPANNRAEIEYQRGEAHSQARLTETQVREVKSSKESVPALARKFGVSKGAISGIRYGGNWGWLS
jgi:hypothetical protein